MAAKIVRREDDLRRFDSLKAGDWFLYDGELHIKLDTGEVCRAEDGEASTIDDDDEVTPVNVTITY